MRALGPVKLSPGRKAGAADAPPAREGTGWHVGAENEVC